MKYFLRVIETLLLSILMFSCQTKQNEFISSHLEKEGEIIQNMTMYNLESLDYSIGLIEIKDGKRDDHLRSFQEKLQKIYFDSYSLSQRMETFNDAREISNQLKLYYSSVWDDEIEWKVEALGEGYSKELDEISENLDQFTIESQRKIGSSILKRWSSEFISFHFSYIAIDPPCDCDCNPS